MNRFAATKNSTALGNCLATATHQRIGAVEAAAAAAASSLNATHITS